MGRTRDQGLADLLDVSLGGLFSQGHHTRGAAEASGARALRVCKVGAVKGKIKGRTRGKSLRGNSTRMRSQGASALPCLPRNGGLKPAVEPQPMAIFAEDTALEAERFLVECWRQSSPSRVRATVGGAWAFGCRLQGRESTDVDPYQVTERVLESLHRLKAEVVVGGSLASSLYGEARFTQDADLLARLDRCQAADLIQELESEFDVSSECRPPSGIL